MQASLNPNAAKVEGVKIPRRLLKNNAYRQVVASCTSLQNFALNRKLNETVAHITARPGFVKHFGVRLQETLSEAIKNGYSAKKTIEKLKGIERDWQHKRDFKQFQALFKKLKVGQTATTRTWTGTPITVTRKRCCFHVALTSKLTAVLNVRNVFPLFLFDHWSLISHNGQVKDILINDVQTNEETALNALVKYNADARLDAGYREGFMHYLLFQRLVAFKRNATLTRTVKNGLAFTVKRVGNALKVTTSINVSFTLSPIKNQTRGYEGIQQLATVMRWIDPETSLDHLFRLPSCNTYVYGQLQAMNPHIVSILTECFITNQSPAIHALIKD
jgi:hypothetical protein